MAAAEEEKVNFIFISPRSHIGKRSNQTLTIRSGRLIVPSARIGSFEPGGAPPVTTLPNYFPIVGQFTNYSGGRHRLTISRAIPYLSVAKAAAPALGNAHYVH